MEEVELESTAGINPVALKGTDRQLNSDLFNCASLHITGNQHILF
jgi:hypothetical protein